SRSSSHSDYSERSYRISRQARENRAARIRSESVSRLKPSTRRSTRATEFDLALTDERHGWRKAPRFHSPCERGCQEKILFPPLAECGVACIQPQPPAPPS